MLVFNNEKTNHLSELESLFSQAKEAVITSPYLMEDLTVFFDTAFPDDLNRVTLYTKLDGQTSELIRKVNSLISIFDYAQEQDDFSVEIRIVNKLHGKAYFAYKDDKPVNAILSSANLTHHGLSKNHEWGIKLSDSQQLNSFAKEIKSLPYRSLNEEQLLELLYRVDKEDFTKNKDTINEIDISDILDPNIIEEIEQQIWLKPIGHTESPIEKGRKFNNQETRLHFSKRRPTGVNINDVIITYGVGVRAILSVYKVLSEPKHITEKEIEEGRSERWPWYVIGKNLTPEFGLTWWDYDLKLNSLQEDFLKKYPENPLTDAGTQSFGAFNYGADKLHLDQNFGNWLYNKVLNL